MPKVLSEDLEVNTALIPQKIKSLNLKIETLRVGEISDTEVALVYIDGIVDEKLVAEVKNRLERIEVDDHSGGFIHSPP